MLLQPSALRTVGGRREGQKYIGIGVARMLTLIERYPDHPASDSARREMGFDVPARPGDFYASDPTLMVLTRVLPEAADPMLGIGAWLGHRGPSFLGARDAAAGEPPVTSAGCLPAIQTAVDENPREPDLERPGLAIGRNPGKDLDERVLNRLVGLRHVAKILVGNP